MSNKLEINDLIDKRFRTPYVDFDTSIFWIDQTDEHSMTQQHLKNDVDINQIVAQFQRTGYLQPPEEGKGDFMDCSDFDDFQASLDRLNGVAEYFSTLPSSTRSFFDNNYAKMVSFIQDPVNRDKAVELGLLANLTPPEEKPIKVEIAGQPLVAPESPPTVKTEGK